MVFKRTRGRRKPPAAKPHKTTITDLPMELIVLILCDIPTRDIFKLRETSRVFANAGTETLRKRLKILYVHPTKASLRKAIEICNSDLCIEIEEVCLVGKVLWHGLRQTFQDPDHGDYTDKLRKLQPHEHNGFRAWPAIMPKAKPGIAKNAGNHDWANAYRELLDALRKLPKAFALSYLSCCAEVGFNHTSDAAVDAHTLKTAQLSLATHTDKAVVPEEFAFTDADALFSVFGALCCRFRGLRVTQDLPFTREIRRSFRGSENYNSLTESFSRLQVLVLAINAGWHESEWQMTCRKMLRHTKRLTNLTLYLKHNEAVRKARLESSVYTLLEGRSFPDLEKFTLEATLPGPRDGRMWRPLPCVFDMAHFLHSHRQKLEGVVLSNVTFGHPNPETTPSENLSRVLMFADGDVGSDEVTGEPIVDKTAGFSLLWTINNYTRDPRCTKTDQGAGHNCKNDCNVLCPDDYFGGLTTAELANLAGSVGVPLIKEKGVWEFTDDDQ